MKLKTAQNAEEGRAIMEKLLDFVRQRDPAYAKELEREALEEKFGKITPELMERIKT